MHEQLNLVLSIYLSGYIIAFLTIKVLMLQNNMKGKLLPVAIISLLTWSIPIYRLYVSLQKEQTNENNNSNR